MGRDALHYITLESVGNFSISARRSKMYNFILYFGGPLYLYFLILEEL
jgi:hypothetical protein